MLEGAKLIKAIGAGAYTIALGGAAIGIGNCTDLLCGPKSVNGKATPRVCYLKEGERYEMSRTNALGRGEESANGVLSTRNHHSPLT